MIDNDIHLIKISKFFIIRIICSYVNDTQSIIHTRCILSLIIHIGADDSNYETEIIIRCISLSIIHTGADDSNNDTEIITRCITLSIIHTGADDPIKKSEIIWCRTY